MWMMALHLEHLELLGAGCQQTIAAYQMLLLPPLRSPRELFCRHHQPSAFAHLLVEACQTSFWQAAVDEYQASPLMVVRLAALLTLPWRASCVIACLLLLWRVMLQQLLRQAPLAAGLCCQLMQQSCLLQT